MENRYTAPHFDTLRCLRLGRLAAAMACACALAAATAQGDGLGDGPGLIAAVGTPQPLPLGATDVAPYESEGAAAGIDPMMGTSAAENPWPAQAANDACLSGPLLVENDCASLGIPARNPATALLADSPVQTAGAPNSGAAQRRSSANAGSTAPEAQDGGASYSGPVLWTIAAIAASGLGVAGLRGPLLAARWTPVRRGIRA